MRFNEIHGHDSIKSYLTSLVDKNRLPHAFIFSGPPGNGKLALALAFASYILCRKPAGGDSCGSCPSCSKTDQQIHPDLHFMIPSASVDAKSTASSSLFKQWRERLAEGPYFGLNDWALTVGTTKQLNIPKVSIQELGKAFGLKTFEGTHKVGIIWQAELMEKEGNRLLKLIEEPPENSVFLLVTDQIDKVLNTLVSRCQIINVPPFRDEDLLAFAREKFGEEQDALAELVRIANGNIIELLNAYEQRNDDLKEQLIGWLRLSFQAKTLEITDWSEQFNRKSRDGQLYFYKYALNFFEQYIRSFYLDQAHLRSDQETLEIMKKMKQTIDPGQAIQIVEMINRCIRNLERNANVKLQMMNSSLTLHKIMTEKQGV